MTDLTHVDVLWFQKRIENWIRFGRIAEEKVVDRNRRSVSFAPGSIFALVRWASNDYGTVASRIDILRAVRPGERYSTVPYVRPGGEILLRLSGWPKVEKVLQAIDAVEALGIDPADAAPEHWHHIHNRLSVGEQPASGLAAQTESFAMTSRSATLVVMIIGVAVVTHIMGAKPMPRFVWNASESVPLGLYSVEPVGKLAVTNLVVAMPPDPLATFLAERGYLPLGVPLIKRILALPGQSVCRNELAIIVDGIETGTALAHDRRGRALPLWQGCRVIAQGEVFLMNWDEPASLDGRYFGPIPLHAIVGRAKPVWTFEDE